MLAPGPKTRELRTSRCPLILDSPSEIRAAPSRFMRLRYAFPTPSLDGNPVTVTSAAPPETNALSPVLVLALDGATFDVIEPMVAAGELPFLGGILRDAQASRLPSTTPPVTFPAWSSFMTGLEPSEHGIFDFTQKQPASYRLRFVNATDRVGDSIFARVSRAGGRVLVLGMPATHPPEPVNGLLVCGFDAPVSSGTDERSASDPALYRSIAAKAGPWMRPELDESARADDFHERAAQTLLDRIDRKRDFALEALAQMRARDGGQIPAFSMIVFPRATPRATIISETTIPTRRATIPKQVQRAAAPSAEIYRGLDAACDQIATAVAKAAQESGQTPTIVVLSDHGMGTASDKVIHLNRYLAESGFLVRRAGWGRHIDRFARILRDRALALLPTGLAQSIFRRARAAAGELESRARFGGLDWAETVAFSEEANTNPGIWINLAGREAEGCVSPGNYEHIRDQVIAALQAWKLPGGAPVVARALRREEVHQGPFAERAPDILVELALDAGHGLSLVPTPWSEGGPQGEGIPSVRLLPAIDHAGGRGRGMNGTHRSDGIWLAPARRECDRDRK